MVAPTDPLYPIQWHLPLIGDLPTIWNDYTGQGVTVVVYDEGVQYTHPDLAANYDASMHFTYHGITYDPTPLNSGAAHGTACAGLIGAVENNGRGGVGVAYDVTLTGVNFLDDLQYYYDYDLQQTSAIYDACMRWAANFDIMSNSWGVSPVFDPTGNLTEGAYIAAYQDTLYDYITTNGRGGLGTIIVKAAGNDSMNSEGGGEDVSRFTLTIAATESDGYVADYSNFGADILVAAPAAAVTTDLTGANGYNGPGTLDGDSLGGDYTSTFNGTSAATPVVAGVVALMLEADDSLGWRDVANILAFSAAQTGSGLGSAALGYEAWDWQDMDGGQWNGGGTAYNLSYGYGMVNAYAAVRMAEAWDYFYGDARTSSNEETAAVDYSGPAIAIPDSDGTFGTNEAAITFNVSAGIEIETVYITVDVTHSFGSDLAIGLITPEGEYVSITYLDGDSSFMDGGLTWTFSLECFRGMSSDGTWTLVIDDLYSGYTGTLNDARIEFFGAEDSANDVFHFTEDWLALVGQDTSRGTIDDDNGGTDWLNFAAFHDAMSVNMASGGQIRIDGMLVGRLASDGTDFENIYTGDGNDTVAGNGLRNEIVGARGNDSLSGLAGADSLMGQSGNDRLFGDEGGDRLWGGQGNDVLNGGLGFDTLYGDDGADTLNGNENRDQLFGGRGADVLNGGFANDALTGGADADTFVFALGCAVDTVLDFVNNVDTLRIDDALWGGAAMTVTQVVSTFASVAGSIATFDFGGGNKIVVNGVTNTNIFLDDLVIF